MTSAAAMASAAATLTPGGEHAEDRLTETFSALAHPIRRALLARLADGAATVNELAEPFDMSLPGISRHIRVLEKAGLITQGRHAQYRPCALNPEPLAAVSSWTETYRSLWESRFDQLDAYLAALQNDQPPRS